MDLYDISQLAAELVHWFDLDTSYVVALSGGVDSAVVACAAAHANADLVAVTGVGPATSQREKMDAQQLVDALGLKHQWLQTGEIQSDDYRRNDLQRCFYCKSHLFSCISQHYPNSLILTGTNLDDLSDYRPGLKAAEAARVRAPLAELKIGKDQVRQLAELWNLHVADKPASPCLASRIAYGVEVTEERLAMIETGEVFLRELLQLRDCRVRLHHDGLARIELSRDAFQKLLVADSIDRVVQRFRELGFRQVTLDLAGQRMGSHNPPAAPTKVVSIQLARSNL